MNANGHYSKLPRERVEIWLKFFSSSRHGLYPHLRSFDCGICSANAHCGNIPCQSSETPQGVGPVNWRHTPSTTMIQELRVALGLDSYEQVDSDAVTAPI